MIGLGGPEKQERLENHRIGGKLQRGLSCFVGESDSSRYHDLTN